MAGHEARINDALKQLGEEFRLGMVQVAEYRSRRKLLLESWGERDVTTSPRSLRSKTATMPVAHKSVAAAAAKKSPVPFLIAAIALLALGAGAWVLLGPAGKPAPSTAAGQPDAVPLSPAAISVRKAAEEFVGRNVWDAESIKGLLDQWNALGHADKARLADEPVMRTLRYRLEQNIQAEMQLITPDSKPEERAQLTLLQDFARALTGESP